MEIIQKMLYGVSAGVVSAIIGYFRHTPVPEFSGQKFLKTIIIGSIVGGVKPYFSEDVTISFLETMGYVTVIDRVADLIWARLKGLWHTIVKPVE